MSEKTYAQARAEQRVQELLHDVDRRVASWVAAANVRLLALADGECSTIDDDDEEENE